MLDKEVSVIANINPITSYSTHMLGVVCYSFGSVYSSSVAIIINYDL